MKFGWPIIVICSILSFVSFSGKGNFLLFGRKAATKEQYNLKRLGTIAGSGFALISIMFAVAIYMDQSHELRWLLTPGISIVGLATILATIKFAKKR